MANSLAEEAGLGARPIHCVWLVQCNSIKHHRDKNPACWSPVRLAGRNNGEFLRLHVPVDMHVGMECSSEPFWIHCTRDAYLAWRVRCCLSAEDVENVDVRWQLICYAHARTGLFPRHICQVLATDFRRQTTSKQIQHKQHRRPKNNNNAGYSAIVLIYWMQFAPRLGLTYLPTRALSRSRRVPMGKP